VICKGARGKGGQRVVQLWHGSKTKIFSPQMAPQMININPDQPVISGGTNELAPLMRMHRLIMPQLYKSRDKHTEI
jgi:hypothetical protein